MSPDSVVRTAKVGLEELALVTRGQLCLCPPSAVTSWGAGGGRHPPRSWTPGACRCSVPSPGRGRPAGLTSQMGHVRSLKCPWNPGVRTVVPSLGRWRVLCARCSEGGRSHVLVPGILTASLGRVCHSCPCHSCGQDWEAGAQGNLGDLSKVVQQRSDRVQIPDRTCVGCQEATGTGGPGRGSW